MGFCKFSSYFFVLPNKCFLKTPFFFPKKISTFEDIRTSLKKSIFMSRLLKRSDLEINFYIPKTPHKYEQKFMIFNHETILENRQSKLRKFKIFNVFQNRKYFFWYQNRKPEILIDRYMCHCRCQIQICTHKIISKIVKFLL